MRTYLKNEVKCMQNQKATVLDIKREVEKHVGEKVRLEAHKSKKKLYHKIGVIEGIYPCIFTVSLAEEDRPKQKLSFSYADVLTKTVKIDLLESDSEDAFNF